jgi:hypothetical protein
LGLWGPGAGELRGGDWEELGQELLRGHLSFQRASCSNEQLRLWERLDLGMQLSVEPLGRF